MKLSMGIFFCRRGSLRKPIYDGYAILAMEDVYVLIYT